MEVTPLLPNSTLEFAHIAREKKSLPLRWKSGVLKNSFEDTLSLWIKSEHTSLLLNCFLLCKTCLTSSCFSVCIAGLLTEGGTGSQQKVPSSLGNWRSTVDWSCNGILNVWEINLNFSSLYIWHRVQCSRKMCKVWIHFHPDYISKVNISIIQVVFPFVFILWC